MKSRYRLPGLGLSLGYTLVYLGLFALFPLSLLVVKSASMSWESFWVLVTDGRVLAALRLTFGASFIAALVNAVFGFLVAWVLSRYTFPLKSVVDVMIDLPFALPTAVAGIALASLYAPSGWVGQFLDRIGVQAAYSPLGVVIALVFIGLPFVVRSVQPVLEALDGEVEEAARSLGASRFQVFRLVIFPTVLPSVLTGFTLAFSRAIGEYGSVVFISGNMPYRTEISPFLIMTKLEQYDYAGATVIASVMLGVSLVMLVMINVLNRWVSRRAGVMD